MRAIVGPIMGIGLMEGLLQAYLWNGSWKLKIHYCPWLWFEGFLMV
jgi:hypothetical protein